jgi:predicted RNase H-like nuclease
MTSASWRASRDALELHVRRAVGIDMPVGLVDGPRDTDAAARALLPGRASSVFSTAVRVPSSRAGCPAASRRMPRRPRAASR